jgi:N-acetylmuramoyl-L-alanine amidase
MVPAAIRGLSSAVKLASRKIAAKFRSLRSHLPPKSTTGALTLMLALCIACSVLLFSAPAEQKRLSIYSNAANYTLTVQERDGQDYVGLLEALEPLGNVNANTSGTHWRLRYNSVETDFVVGSPHARVRRGDFDLHANFLLEDGHGLVPVASLGPLLSRILGGPVTFHQASRRLFIGSVAVHFTAQLSKENPPRLVMNFTAPVNPMIATEPGKLRMFFTKDPLVPPSSPSLTFDNAVIPSASYSEDNGSAEIAINATAPLFARFSNGNRTITITSPASAAAASAQPAPGSAPQGQPAGNAAPASATSAPSSAPPSAPATYFAVVDASHGGSERGEALTDRMAEKDITLALARSLRQALQSRGLTTLVLRDGDATLTADQRAALANTSHPAIYISLHATSQGRGVRLYTALLPAGGQNSGPFLDWNTAQASFTALSQAAAASVAGELQKKQVPTRVLLGPLRPLNNIASAALAVEVAPLGNRVSDLSSSAYQGLLADSVAAGVLSLRDRLVAGR